MFTKVLFVFTCVHKKTCSHKRLCEHTVWSGSSFFPAGFCLDLQRFPAPRPRDYRRCRSGGSFCRRGGSQSGGTTGRALPPGHTWPPPPLCWWLSPSRPQRYPPCFFVCSNYAPSIPIFFPPVPFIPQKLFAHHPKQPSPLNSNVAPGHVRFAACIATFFLSPR